ncbi:putative Ig domain-containing protein, partial [Mucilaginibacter sp. OK098]|uniref:putative Ig domain-containing protein n=1 Tax=Mucilaginibacter sp. OK098 TaxID=1855297 RepID=UPI0009123E19
AANNVFVTDYGNNAVKEIKPIGGFYISPALPAGLSFNNTTGVISGTPTASKPATDYTVTVYKSSGSNSTLLNIKVNAVSISYVSPKTYVTGTAIAALSPTISGGVAAAPAYSSSTTTLGSGFNIPAGIAVDAAGNIYIGDQNNNVVKKIPGGTGTPVVIGTGFNTPDGVAVDAAGNVYVADDGNNLVKEIPVGGGPIITLGSGFLQPFNVAVDAAGNVYVADRGNNAIKEIPVGGGAVITLGSGFTTPTGVAVDAYGNVYVADFGNSAIKEIPVGGGAPITLGSGFSTPFGVAVDGSGNVFVTDYGHKQVKEIPIGGGAPVVIGSGFSFLFGVVVDAANNVFVTDYGNNAVKEIKPIGGFYISPALPAGLSFNNTTGVISGTPTASKPATDYTVTVYNGTGSNTATVNIKVNAVSISYASPQTYVAGKAIAPLAPTISGGVAAAPAYSSSTTTLGSGFNIPAGIAVDAAGNIYIGDQNNNVVKKIPGGTGTPVV